MNLDISSQQTANAALQGTGVSGDPHEEDTDETHELDVSGNGDIAAEPVSPTTQQRLDARGRVSDKE